ncbi:hypothetical protein HOA92_07040 [archaeon]|jgi:hypothetical protein|nr:hypothetical protein [archaeon]MBT6762768.1 hypothetical protein [archaeon]
MEWFEPVLFYFLVVDCIVYAVLTFTHGEAHKKAEKALFLGKTIPFSPLMSIGYFVLVCWLGSTLWRLGLLF